MKVELTRLDQPDVPDLAFVRQFLLKEGYLAKEQVIKLIQDVTRIFRKGC